MSPSTQSNIVPEEGRMESCETSELEDEVDDEDTQEQNAPYLVDSRKRQVTEDLIRPFIVQTPFDAYFTQASTTSRTSANIFSALTSPLTAEEYSALVTSSSTISKDCHHVEQLEQIHRRYFPHYLVELSQGFNLVFYGLGSKRNLLNAFATDSCALKGHAIIVNAFLPNFALKDLLLSIENVSGLSSMSPKAHGIENQARRIHQYYSASPGQSEQRAARPLFLIIHNIDSTTLRTDKARTCLTLLAMSTRIHLVVSMDHVNTPVLWSNTAISIRKPKRHTSAGVSKMPSVRGFAWVWHDITTLLPYDFEMSSADRSSYDSKLAARGHHGRNAGIPTPVTGALMSESAAQHILASVTQKAKKLFVLLGRKQIVAMQNDRQGADGIHVATPLHHYATQYDLLFTAARDDFIVTNDTALRALLGEFRDHGLVVSTTSSVLEGGEALWIPLRKELLTRILNALTT